MLDDKYTVTGQMLRQRPEMAEDGYKVGDRVPGRVLHARYSRYMQRLRDIDAALVDEIAEVGRDLPIIPLSPQLVPSRCR